MWQFRRWPWFFTRAARARACTSRYDGGGSWKKLQEEDGLPKGELGASASPSRRSNPRSSTRWSRRRRARSLRSERRRQDLEDRQRGRTSRRGRSTSASCGSTRGPEPRLQPGLHDPRVERRRQDVQDAAAGEWDEIHGDHHALWIDPARSRPHVRRQRRRRGREPRPRPDLALRGATCRSAQFYHVAVDMREPYNVYGGLQDNGSWRGPSAVWQQGGIRNHHWRDVGCGDGFDDRCPTPTTRRAATRCGRAAT